MIDKEISVTMALINLNLCINKLLFRKKLEPKKSAGIDQQILDLEQVMKVLIYLEEENKELFKKFYATNLDLIKAYEKIDDLKIYEND